MYCNKLIRIWVLEKNTYFHPNQTDVPFMERRMRLLLKMLGGGKKSAARSSSGWLASWVYEWYSTSLDEAAWRKSRVFDTFVFCLHFRGYVYDAPTSELDLKEIPRYLVACGVPPSCVWESRFADIDYSDIAFSGRAWYITSTSPN